MFCSAVADFGAEDGTEFGGSSDLALVRGTFAAPVVEGSSGVFRALADVVVVAVVLVAAVGAKAPRVHLLTHVLQVGMLYTIVEREDAQNSSPLVFITDDGMAVGVLLLQQFLDGCYHGLLALRRCHLGYEVLYLPDGLCVALTAPFLDLDAAFQNHQDDA